MTGVEPASTITQDIAPVAVPHQRHHPALVSVVIVSWNTADLLEQCLQSIRQHSGADGVAQGLEVIVVDNASTDGSADVVRRCWPTARLVVNEDNVGYQRANNTGMRLATGEHLLLINADAMLTPGCLDRLLERMRRDPRAAIVGPRLTYGDGTFQRWTAGREPRLRSAATYLLGLDRLPTRAFDGIFVGTDCRTAFTPDWVSSACMLVRRSALDEIGLMDESYFAYMDDVDLCRRARAAGWNVWYEPSATAVHLMGQSTKRQTGQASPAALRNFNRYFMEQNGTAATFALRALQVAGFGARAAAYAALAVRSHDDAAKAAAQGHLRNVNVVVRATMRQSRTPQAAPAPHGHAHGHGHGHGGHVPTQRQLNEAAVYDARAREVAASIDPAELVIAAEHPPYPNREHVEFLDYTFTRLGDLTGKRILEVGCGGGTLSTYAALRGAEVVGLDVSVEMLRLAERRAEVNGVADRVRFVDCPVEDYAEPDGSFDAVIGNQTLHHLELREAMSNIRRLLRPGGVAVFCEPVLFLPELFRTVRNSRVVEQFFPERTDTPDERSLGRAEVALIRSCFDHSEMHEFQLTARLQNFVELSDPWFARLQSLDRRVLARVPALRSLCRYVVLVLASAGDATQGGKAT